MYFCLPKSPCSYFQTEFFCGKLLTHTCNVRARKKTQQEKLTERLNYKIVHIELRFDLTALTPLLHPLTLHPSCTWAWDQGSGHGNWADLQGLTCCVPRRVCTPTGVSVQGRAPFLSLKMFWTCAINTVPLPLVLQT